MTRFVFCALIGFAFSFVGCEKSEPSKGMTIGTTSSSQGTSNASPLTKAENRSLTMLLSTGETLRYSVHLPEGFDGRTMHPLVLSLHYGGRVQPFYGGGMIDLLVAPALQELKPIIVAPDSLEGGWDSESNRQAVDELLEKILKDYPVDRAKTLVTGFSMGGHGTWVVARRRQDLFRAAIPIAGRPLSEARGQDWKIPVYAIHSRADQVVPIEPTKLFVEKLQSSGADVTFVEVPDLSHYRTYEFVKPLKESIPWLKKTWERPKP